MKTEIVSCKCPYCGNKKAVFTDTYGELNYFICLSCRESFTKSKTIIIQGE